MLKYFQCSNASVTSPVLHFSVGNKFGDTSESTPPQVKSDNEWDAHAIETTAYALLVYIKSDGIGVIQENIVRFLSAMREMDGGVITSIVGFEIRVIWVVLFV